MAAALLVTTNLTSAELRRLAWRANDRAQSLRLIAIANAVDGMPRTEVARLAGVDVQTVRDWVVRFNAEGAEGLIERRRSGRPDWLNEYQLGQLHGWMKTGPDPETDGFSRWRIVDAIAWVDQKFGISYSEEGMRRILHALGLSYQKARPQHPKSDPAVREDFKKKTLPSAVEAVKLQQPDKEVQVWFMDEARIGQKGRPGHRWWTKGERAPGVCDQRFVSTYIYGAVRPMTDDAFALVLPEVNAASMQIFLDMFSASLCADVHVMLILDNAGWHDERAVQTPENLTLLPLPSHSPQLNPVENIWLYLRENFLSHRLFDDYDAIMHAACKAWNRLRAETGRIKSISSFPWIAQVPT